MNFQHFQVDIKKLSRLREAVNSESTATLSVTIGKCFELIYLRTETDRTLRVEWTLPSEVRSRLAAEAAMPSFPYRQSLKLLSLSSINKREILNEVDNIEALNTELTPKVEAIIAQMELYPDSQSLIEKFDDIFLSHELFIYSQLVGYESYDPKFQEHTNILGYLKAFPSNRITGWEVDNQHLSIWVKRSPLLTQVATGLENKFIVAALIREIAGLAVLLEEHSVLPAFELFAYKPMPLRVVVVPVLAPLESRSGFYQRLTQLYWKEVVNLIEAPVVNSRDFSENRNFEGLVLRDADVLCYENFTYWRLYLPRPTLFYYLLWKNCKCLMQVIPLMISNSSVPVEATVMESPFAGSFSTNECIDSEVARVSDFGQYTIFEQFTRLGKLTTVPTSPQGEMKWTVMEENCAGFLSDNNNLSDLLAICFIVKSLHEEGKFHGLLCASTIRVTSNYDHFLSLTAFSWENLPLLYFAIPLLDRKTIAPEVKLLAKSLQQPSEPIAFSKSDTFGLSALILTCGLSLCESNPRLHEIVIKGVNRDWRLRPKFAEVAEELRMALGEA